MKLIQLNCWEFAFKDKLFAFLKIQNPDIINLQEVSTAFLSPDLDYNLDLFLCKLKTELGMRLIFAPTSGNFDRDGNIQYIGNAVLTKLEILDYQIIWDKYNQNSPKIRTVKELTRIEELCKIDRNLAYPFVFEDVKNVIYVVLKLGDKKFRNATTQFTVSQKCTETIQAIRQANQIMNFLDNSLDMPTILTGDLNIERNSGIIRTLLQKFEIVNDNRCTLNSKTHQSMLANPNWQGVSVDYILQKDIKILDYRLNLENLSDHLCLITEFEL
jgi:endonuclease/exonuclease/phosphatase family metal-dependent hydrolase